MILAAIFIFVLGFSFFFGAWSFGWQSKQLFSFWWKFLLVFVFSFGLILVLSLENEFKEVIALSMAGSFFAISGLWFFWCAFYRWQFRVEIAAEQLAKDGDYEKAITLLNDKIHRQE